MEHAPAKIDTESVQHQTDFARARIDAALRRALQYATDPDKKMRLAEGFCISCFYSGPRIGGAAMTERPCGVCGTKMMFGSTATDKVCQACAVKQELCRECGADLRLRPRRKFEKGNP